MSYIINRTKKDYIKLCDDLMSNSDINKIYAQTCEINYSSRKLLEYCGFNIHAKLQDHHMC